MVSPTFVGSGTARKQIGSIITYVCLNGYSIDQAFTMAYNESKSAAGAK